MSVINETLDNLKENKKGKVGALNPSSSAHRGTRAAKAPFSLKSFIVPVSFAILVGVVYFVSQMHSSSLFSKNKEDKSTAAWLSQTAKATTPTKASPQHKTARIYNPQAQSQYYIAMNLLNEGKETLALESLKEIIEQYPDFTPAKNVYSMLTAH
ncbi:MAG: hypothetical protein NXI01_07510 [Gammaproteobacteria bacterium]|nr:hypothetical protein [Gammaproteobacteria bacterium]